MRHHRCALLAALLLATLTLGACRPQGSDGVQALTACRLPGIDREVQCGTVGMPEDPNAPEGRRIDVHFAVVPAIARNKQPDPVFVLAGGPGQAATRLAGQVMPLMSALNARRDIVFIDQRGTGRSNPFDCPRDDRRLDADLDPSRQLQRLQDCVQAFAGDPRHYTTWVAVRDFDAVRRALGAEQVNLWGASYGTRAALEYLRQFPQQVRTVVLDGVAPPDMVLPEAFSVDSEAALAALVRLCAADERCRAAYPDFEARVARLLARAAQAPTIEVAHPLTGATERAPLDAQVMAGLLRGPLYAPTLAAVLPFAIAEASEGRYAPLVTLSLALTGGVQDNFAIGMHFAVVCAEDVPRLGRQAAPASRFGTVFADTYARACQALPAAAVPDAFYEVAASPVPVLLLSGGLDPATPPRHAEAVARRLGNATHWVAPNLAHGVSLHACAPQLIARFVREASAAGLDSSCLQAIPPPSFYRRIEPAAPRSGS